MKNQLLRRLNRVSVGLIITVMWFGLSACAGSIDGQVFFDENGDGTMGLSETPAPFVLISILKDGKEITRGYSDHNGVFRAKSKGPGEYCIQTDVSLVQENFGEVSAIRSKFTTADSSGEICTDANLNGTCDEDEEPIEEEDVEDESDQVDNTPETPQSSGWTQKGHCQSIKGRNLSVSIGIGIDYTEIFNGFPARITRTVHPEEEFEVSIFKPRGCELKDLYLDEHLAMSDNFRGGVFNPSLNRISFRDSAARSRNEAAASKIKSSSLTPSISIQDLDVFDLKLVAGDIDKEEVKLTITPHAICGDEDYPLPSIPVTITKDFDLSVVMNKLTISPVSNGYLKFTVLLINSGKNSLKSGELRVVLPERTNFTEMSQGCSNLGKKALCAVPEIEADSEMQYTLTMKIPEIDRDTNFKIEANFKSDEFEIDAESIDFDIIVPVTP